MSATAHEPVRIRATLVLNTLGQLGLVALAFWQDSVWLIVGYVIGALVVIVGNALDGKL